MKILAFFTILFLLLSHGGIASADSVRLEFEIDGFTGSSSGGSGQSGLPWGILVDTMGDGFRSGQYESFDPTVPQFLPSFSGLTDDYFLPGGVTFDNTASGPPGSPYFNGDDGLIGFLIAEFNSASSPISSGDKFALLWTESDNYGLLTHPDYQFSSGITITDLSTQTATAIQAQGQSTSAQMTDLLRYAFGIAPDQSTLLGLAIDGSLNGMPRLTVTQTTGSPPSATVYFVRRDDHSLSGSILYTPQVSPDLLGWTDLTDTPVVVTDSQENSDYELVSVTPASTGDSMRFFRIAVSVVP